MTTVLLLPGGKCVDEKPIARFVYSLDAAIDYYNHNHSTEDIIFLVSGRWKSVTDTFLLTEAEIGKRYILQAIPDAKIIKEDISVELAGNYAFSKPLISALNPDKAIVLTSELLYKRSLLLAMRIFSDSFSYEIRIITHELSDNPVLVEKERQAINLYNKLFDGISDGDDTGFRERLLYSTPYYFKGIVDDKDFFDSYWVGGFDSFINGIGERDRAQTTTN